MNYISNTASETASNAVIETILSRSAAKYFDTNAVLSDDQIRDLVRIGTSAPTSFHLQNWRFIAVRTPEAKARLHPIAWKQPAILDAAVTFVIIGQLADASTVPARLAPVVEAGIMPAHLVPEWEAPARSLYDNQPQRQRDEAVLLFVKIQIHHHDDQVARRRVLCAVAEELVVVGIVKPQAAVRLQGRVLAPRPIDRGDHFLKWAGAAEVPRA